MSREDEIRARLEAATPGGWRSMDAFGVLSIWADEPDENDSDVEIAFVEDRHLGNAALIANAPDDLRYLLDAHEDDRLAVENTLTEWGVPRFEAADPWNATILRLDAAGRELMALRRENGRLRAER